MVGSTDTVTAALCIMVGSAAAPRVCAVDSAATHYWRAGPRRA